MFALELRILHNLQLVGQVPRLSSLSAVPFESDKDDDPLSAHALCIMPGLLFVAVRVFPR